MLNDLPSRKRPAHLTPIQQHNRANIVFLTVCTRARKPLLASDAAISLLAEAWTAADFWCVGRFMVLPDHIHLFCAPASSPPHPLRQWISFWQRFVACRWPNPEEKPLWQKDYWDRQLRSQESYAEKWTYVRNNPVRHGLADSADAWPYQGELNRLWWHD